MKEAYDDIQRLQQLLENMKRDLPGVVQLCLQVSDKLYESQAPEVWREIGELVGKMDELYRHARIVVDAIQGDSDNEDLLGALELFVRDFSAQFQVMNRFMDGENYRDAADCLKYELAEMLARLSRALGDEIAAMEARYAKNMAYLSERFPKVYIDLKDVEPDWLNYQIVFAKTGMPNLKIRTGDNWIRFYSHYDPEAEAARWASNVARNVEDFTDFMIYGLGFGYHLLLLGMHLPDAKVSVYEPDKQIFIAAMHAIDLESLFSRVNVIGLLVGGDKIRREQMVVNFMKKSGSSPSVQAIPVYERLSIDDMRVFCENARMASMYYVTSLQSYRRFGMEWLRNRLFNLPMLLDTPSLRNLKGLFAGKTAVVVGAGPSLEADIPVLRELKRHALIIAAGSSIQSLLHYGIEPHLIVFIDGGEVNLKVYGNPAIRDIPLLFAPMAQRRVIESRDKRNTIHFYLQEDFATQYLMGVDENDPCFEVMPSVTGNAIDAAIYLGCTEIVLAGQDLSYPESRVYAPGVSHFSQEEQQQIIKDANYTLENISGGLNPATHGMVVTLASIEGLLSKYPDIAFTNTTRYGAKINFTRWEPMEDVLQRLRNEEMPDRVIEDLLAKHAVLYDEERKTQTETKLSLLPVQLEDFEKRLEAISDTLEQLPELSQTRSPLCITCMQDIELEWGKVISSIPFMILMVTGLMNEVRNFDRDRPQLERETNIERKAELFVKVLGPLIEAMRACLPELKEMINTAVERTEAILNR